MNCNFTDRFLNDIEISAKDLPKCIQYLLKTIKNNISDSGNVNYL